MARELFVEVRTEELPAGMVLPALAGLAEGVLGLLAGVEHGDVRTWATPRRLAVAVSDVAEARPVKERLVTGPPADRAFQDGAPTKVAIGFARGRGVDPSALEVVDGPRGPVVAARITEGGEATAELVSAGLGEVVRGLPFRKSMEWGTGGLRFGRPIQSIAALFGGGDGAALDAPAERAPLDFVPRRRALREYAPIPHSRMGDFRWLDEAHYFVGVDGPGGWVESGDYAIVFAADGTTDFVLLKLADAEDHRLVLEIEPLLQSVRLIREGVDA